MGIMDKIQFWKKKDEDLFGDIGKHDNLPPLKNDPLTSNNQSMPNNPLSDHSMDSNFVQPLGKDPFGQPQQQQQPSTRAPDITTAFAAPQQDFGYDQHQSPNNNSNNFNKPPEIPNHDSQLLKKELEVISSKLDFLKASLETINRRLDNIESASRYEYGQAPRR